MFVELDQLETTLDVFRDIGDFAWEAMRTRVTHNVDGHEISFLSAEAIAVFKLLFFRAKDVGDLDRMVAVHAPLDVAYVREKLVQMMGENDERVQKWDALVTSAGKA